MTHTRTFLAWLALAWFGGASAWAQQAATAPATRAAPPAAAAPRPVALVCDGSASMAGPKFERMRDEVTGMVSRLAPGRQFALVFFVEGQAVALDGGRTLDATDENRRRAADFIARVAPSGASDPVAALELAMPQSRTVYLMTDGRFASPENVTVALRDLAPKHRNKPSVVLYVSPSTEAQDDVDRRKAWATAVVQEHGGFYRVSDVDKPRRERAAPPATRPVEGAAR